MFQKRLLAFLLLGILCVVLMIAGCQRNGSRGRVAANTRAAPAGSGVKPAEVLSAVAYRQPAGLPGRKTVAAPAPAVQEVPVQAAAGWVGPVYTLSGYEPPLDQPLIQPPAALASARADLAPVYIPPLAPAARPAPAAPLPELTPDSYSLRRADVSIPSRPLEAVAARNGGQAPEPDRLEIQRALLPLDWRPTPLPLASLEWDWVASSATAMRGDF